MHRKMDKRNRELARKNAELKEQIAKLSTEQIKLLKDNIKKEYLGARAQEKINKILEDSIKLVENALFELRELRSKVLGNPVLKDKSN